MVEGLFGHCGRKRAYLELVGASIGNRPLLVRGEQWAIKAIRVNFIGRRTPERSGSSDR